MDIEDLLDEVEQAIQDTPMTKKASWSTSSTTTTSSNSSSSYRDEYRTTNSTMSRIKTMDDIDDLLNMIDDESPSAAVVHPRPSGRPSYTASNTSAALAFRTDEFHVSTGTKKCSTLMLGGERAKRGVNTAFAAQTVCGNLRCNECDFTVVQFMGKTWSSSVDYMFFRENMPNEAKLRARMDSSPDSAAYACQCKWLSIDVATRADMCRVKWCCAGH